MLVLCLNSLVDSACCTLKWTFYLGLDYFLVLACAVVEARVETYECFVLAA